MSTFKLSEPVLDNDKIIITKTMSDFSEFLAACSYKLGYVEKMPGSETNYIVNIINVNESFPVEMIVGKKYIRMMDKRLSPSVTSQFTYDKDLNLDKYKKNIVAIMDSIRGFNDTNDKILDIISKLSKIDDPDEHKMMEKKYGVDEINILGKTIIFEKSFEGSMISIKLSNINGRFAFKVIYPENEVFGMLDNFLPENNMEPKMNGINNRIAEHNAMAGKIIQKLIYSEIETGI
jgi:hypothetical protein